MKRFILVLCLLMYSSVLFAAGPAATAVPTWDRVKVWKKGPEYTTIYEAEFGDSVVVGNPIVYAVPMFSAQGKITEVTFESSSTAWQVFFSHINEQLSPSIETFLAWSETSSTIGSPELSMPRTYYNGDDPQTNIIYFTIVPVTVDSGLWSLSVTEIRY